MEVLDDIKAAKEVISALLKAKKSFRMYPENNPMYAKIIDDTYLKFKNFFDYKEELTLKLKQNEIYCDLEQIYYSTQKEDNLALFFFKDGLREITFKNGFAKKELEDFLKILTVDYDREVLDDDVVTLMWEKDFHNVKYVVDESFLVEDENYETGAVQDVKGKATGGDDLARAYSDAFEEHGVKEISIVPLTDKDLHILVKEIEKDGNEKTSKIITIIFEMLYQAENKSEYEDTVHFLTDAIDFSIRHGNLESVIDIMMRTKEIVDSPQVSGEIKKYLNLVFSFAASDSVIKLLGEFFDSGVEIDDKILNEYIKFLDKSAIKPFITILGDLKTIPARKHIINALITLGKKDIQSVASGLYDSRWYVVRNIIYVLGKIGDKQAVDYLLRTVNHSDIRVRKEVIKALGELGTAGVLQTLKECLDDPEVQIRTSAARSLGNIHSTAAKGILLQKLSGKNFIKKDFNEKKEFYEVLSHWKDNDVVEFIMAAIKKKSFFKRAMNDETKACAIYALGLIGNKDVLPLLQKVKDSNNRIIREYAYTAVKRIEYGQ
ncbi:MAG: HEAT repeat domain-containing protein [Nitrospirae bacterium]|nr:HEAT repeat domain-containing protein [Nitrospirota bacterium]